MAAHASETFVPAAGRAWLTGAYDRAIALTMREARWRPALVRAVAASVPPGGRAVEVGCGTGTLSVALAAERADAEIVAVDPDPSALAIARAKPGAGRVRWHQAFAHALPLEDGAADAALCSLVLHHLADDAKAAALSELARVLRGGATLHVADWGPPRGPAPALGARALQLLDGREGPASLLAGALPRLLDTAGFRAPERRGAVRTVWGTLELWHATRVRT